MSDTVAAGQPANAKFPPNIKKKKAVVRQLKGNIFLNLDICLSKFFIREFNMEILSDFYILD